ncbi:mediator of RNA polymerase II transcription subunit 15 [Drosophila subobscura]|uniref:mediator of RNA polymerase II transcription subunit 15 n=1 Tax=Drosophila subobscura TaxID=7241 RepID=UPI00155AF9C1|nr:mediator of RNA polymerase II transcription subunit 15 [Drosophila subobscura]
MRSNKGRTQSQDSRLPNASPFAVYQQQQQQQQQQQAAARGGKPKPSAVSTLQQQQLQQQHELQQQQQQQQLLAQSGVAGQRAQVPTYADQMQAAFLDYQRQRAEFEQQQQQLLQKLYQYYPDMSNGQAQAQIQPDAAGSRFVYRRPQFGSNGLQQQQQQQQQGAAQGQAVRGAYSAGDIYAGAAGGRGVQAAASSGDFYSTQQHMGFLQQQQQDVLREQQQQFANSQLAPSTTQSYGMAVPMSSVLGSPSFQPSSDVSHVSFSSGNLNYNF